MKKRILATVLGLVLLIMAGAAAFAVDGSKEWEVRYEGGKDLQSNYHLNNMADQVFKLQPGDEIEMVANLLNNDSDPSNWYMTNTVINTLEETRTSTIGGAYSYRLTYQGPNDPEELELYNSESVGGDQEENRAVAADNRIGLQQATEGLEDWLYLDTLAAGQRGVVKLYVALDGESQGNTYQDTLAKLQLNFAVDPVTSYEETQSRTRTDLRVVQTGDINEALPFIILAGISGLLLLAFGLLGLGEKKRAKQAAKTLTCLMLAGVLALTMPAALGLAAYAEGEPETPEITGTTIDMTGWRSYTVRLYLGKQVETAAGATVTVTQSASQYSSGVTTQYPATGTITLENVPYGAFVSFNISDPSDGNGTKYYIEGVREAGEDNDSSPNFQVTRDVDYVLAYGIKGQRVQYTLRFVDTAGNRLADDITYWGNVGDKPIVACQYIEGYRPNALNMTGTLKADEENIFEFVYTPLDTNVVYTDGGVIYIDGGVTVIGGGGAGGGGGGGAPGGPAGPAAPGGEELPEEPTPLAPPEEIVDLDEQKTPLAGLVNDFASSLFGLSMPLRVALVVGVVALGCFIILAFTKKKRKKQDAAEG